MRLQLLLLVFAPFMAMAQGSESPICSKPEIEAQYFGGQDSVFAYIQRNLVYPEDALNADREGYVKVECTIERNGSISIAKVVESVYPSLDREALRLVYNMPSWKPAISNGNTCRSIIIIGMRFSLDYEKARRKKARKARRTKRRL